MTRETETTNCSTVCEVCNHPSYSRYPLVDGRYLCRLCESKYRHPRWIRGRYNGKRIVGVSFKIVLRVTDWQWKPMIGGHCGMFHWLFWRSWTEPDYEN